MNSSSQVSFATASKEATSTLSTSYGSALVSGSVPSGPAPVSGVSSLGVAPGLDSSVSQGVAPGQVSGLSTFSVSISSGQLLKNQKNSTFS